MAKPRTERKPNTYAYTLWYAHESDEEHAQRVRRLKAAGAREVYFDKMGHTKVDAPLTPGRFKQLRHFSKGLLHGDIVLCESLDRFGYWPRQFDDICERFKLATIRFLDVEALYGDEEPPCVWFAQQLAQKQKAMRELARKSATAKVFGTCWQGVGWTRRKTKGGSEEVWQKNRVMRWVGYRIVELRDIHGKRWDSIASRLNSEGLHYRDCSPYSCRPWNEKLVREYYLAARADWPYPKKVTATQLAKHKGKLPPLPEKLPPVNRFAGRPVRQSDLDSDQRRIANAEKILARIKKTAANRLDKYEEQERRAKEKQDG